MQSTTGTHLGSRVGQQTYSQQTHIGSSPRSDGLTGGLLRVHIIGASNLRNTDLGITPGDVSDPFLVAKLGRHVTKMRKNKEFTAGKQEFKTEVIDNNLNPVWKRNQFEFQLDNEEEDILRLEVFNSNWTLHDSLGWLEVALRHDVYPGQARRLCAQLEDGDEGALEVEVTLLTQQQLQNGDAVVGSASPHAALTAGPGGCTSLARPGQQGQGGRHGQKSGMHAVDLAGFQNFAADHAAALAHRNYLQHKVPHKVPLPDFAGMGKEAFEPPPRKIETAPVGELRRKMEYQSQACHLGQYDYSGDQPIYYPKQDKIDKGMWQSDPFYGWRAKDEHHHHPQQPKRSVLSERNQDAGSGAQELELWNRDPFHGWLKHGKDGRPEVGSTNGKEQAAQVARHLASLPSFREAPRRRFEDHREYAGGEHHPATRGRLEEQGRGGRRFHEEDDWSQDAFYGWLPGRGPSSQEKHLLHRPLQKARDMHCPSFSEQVVGGVRGRGIGVLKVWVTAADNLEYAEGSGIRGLPSPCVRMKLGSQEKMTDTINDTSEPRWQGTAFVFEVDDVNDRLMFEVCDLVGKDDVAGGGHASKYFLGKHEVYVNDMIEHFTRVAQSGGDNEPATWQHHLDGTRRGRITYDTLFEPYDSDATRRYEMQRAIQHDHYDVRHHHTLGHQPSTGHSHSMASHRSIGRPVQRSFSGVSQRSDFHGSIGRLSVRVIAAYQLVNKDSGYFGDYSDPYVTLRLRSNEDKKPKRTATIPNDLNPKWNSSPFFFPIHREDDELLLEVFDDDNSGAWIKGLSSDDFIGRMTIPLEKFIHVPNKSMRIRDALQDVPHGELEVEIGFSPE